MARYTAEEKYTEALREIGYRMRVYPRLVDLGRMTEAHADQCIAIMREIADDYHELARKERLL